MHIRGQFHKREIREVLGLYSIDRYFWVTTTLLLSVLAFTQVTTILHESQTSDEAVYLAAGYSYLQTGDFRLDPEQPHLGKILNALPLLLLHPHLPLEDWTWKANDQFGFGRKFLYENRVSADRLLFTARTVTMLLTLLLGLYIAVSTRSSFGSVAAAFALFLFCFDPTVIAHGRYVTTDMILTLFVFVACRCWTNFLEHRNTRDLLLTALSVGAALLSKFSAVLLIPILASLYWFRWWQESHQPERQMVTKLSMRHFFTCLGVMALVSFPTIWATYAFESSKLIADEDVAKFLNQPGRMARVPGFLGKYLSGGAAPTLFLFIAHHVPIPMYSFWKGFYKVLILRRESYLLGTWYETGSLFYFPVAVAVKTPLSELMMLAITIVLGFRLLFKQASTIAEQVRRLPFRLAALIIPVVIYFSASAVSRVNLGIRYILPIYPFVFVIMAAVLFHYKTLGAASVLVRRAALVLSAVFLIESVTIYPDYLAFFNWAAGGPSNGPKYLIDSNIDWGQDLKRLGDYVTARHIDNLCLSYFGWAPPSYYGIRYSTLDSFDQTDRLDGCVRAVSVNSLYSPRFAELRKYKPDAKIGYSIYLYYPRSN